MLWKIFKIMLTTHTSINSVITRGYSRNWVLLQEGGRDPSWRTRRGKCLSLNKAPLQGGKGNGVIVGFLHEIVPWVHRQQRCRAQKCQLRHKPELLSCVYEAKQYEVIHSTSRAEKGLLTIVGGFVQQKRDQAWQHQSKYSICRGWMWSTMDWSEIQ